FQAEDGIRDRNVTGVQTCALPIYHIVDANSAKGAFNGLTYHWLCLHKGIFMHALKRFEKTWLFGLFIFTWCLVEVASACTRVVRSEERRVGKEGRDGGWRGEVRSR